MGPSAWPFDGPVRGDGGHGDGGHGDGGHGSARLVAGAAAPQGDGAREGKGPYAAAAEC